jgi:hypothetical protein
MVLQMVKTRSILVSVNMLETASVGLQISSSLPLGMRFRTERMAPKPAINEFHFAQVEGEGDWAVEKIVADGFFERRGFVCT